jgi:ectoine hydroxylase-related dioxygenase (phytanoyl-CoA dioxygenase family)
MKLLIIFEIILLILFVTLVLKSSFTNVNKNKKYNLNTDGATVIPKILNENDLKYIEQLIIEDNLLKVQEYILKSVNVKNKVNEILGPDYVFQDYIFMIKKSRFNACHRDYNGAFFNKEQKHPSYTILFFIENMDRCLDIIPKSHVDVNKNLINITDITESVTCSKGDAILFDANLIHSGSFNKKEDNIRIQMKVSHINDIDKSLGFFQNYHKVLNKSKNNPLWRNKLEKHISCVLPGISQFTHKYDKNVNKDTDKNSIMYSILNSFVFADIDNMKK